MTQQEFNRLPVHIIPLELLAKPVGYTYRMAHLPGMYLKVAGYSDDCVSRNMQSEEHATE
jgi:hypothetical protein